ncbi:acetyltransferase, GNAT family protein [Trichomonas vaginalis G3]|uniref:Acetyltransferase, GNAT family protein n=1 Tax=Trichomonas vaginalis (strain ATCC PRA-98 / G3) TaxID=412133 RepID=A2D9B1_TRIV3|nr:peptide alpha-N-acetyltransferase protein [Trichomonas vaginalis G3]EAY23137.1 acetyltransferase, GNAT family protein [Trichomonas vaginalis G3]KAI5513796.1 peptide alpha-N-acetyltransferase protein [Trichomonas vaginalis G3]|eukprot:XP_001584123.1 acetyltransferase, GNAT family protein [Trichomonas vaginalis G3]
MGNCDVVFEQVNLQNYQQLMRLDLKCFQRTFSLQYYIKVANAKEFVGFLALLDGVIIGEMTIRFSEENGIKCGYVYSFGILSDYRSKGYGSKLFKFGMDKLNECRKVTLHVKVSNENAQKIYTKNMFKIHERIPKYYGDDDGYLMLFERESTEQDPNSV